MSKFPVKQAIYCVSFALNYLKSIDNSELSEDDKVHLSDAIDSLSIIVDPEYLPF